MSGRSSSSSAPGRGTATNSGTGTTPGYSSPARSLARSSYSISPRPFDIRQPNTAFTASTTSPRERKLSRRKTRRGTPSGWGASA